MSLYLVQVAEFSKLLLQPLKDDDHHDEDGREDCSPLVATSSMALGDRIELLRVRLEAMLGEAAFIHGDHCRSSHHHISLSIIAAYEAIQSGAEDARVLDLLAHKSSALRLLQVAWACGV